jgi:WhiB family transcriptional regulator, redox-sensing transcriptional regulator
MDSVFTPSPASYAVVGPLGHRARIPLPCQFHDADLWFADDPAELEAAKALCGDCQERVACLLGALHRREPTGVWGGQILDGGVILSFKRPRGRPRKHAEAAPPHRPAVPA